MRKDEFLKLMHDTLDSLPDHTEVEVLTEDSTLWWAPMYLYTAILSVEVLDMRGNRFAMGQPHENEVSVRIIGELA